MAVTLIPDQQSANDLLDTAFGTASSALDLYAKWNETKNPTATAPNTPATGLAKDTPAAGAATAGTVNIAGMAVTPQMLIILGGVILVGVVMFMRKK